MPWTSCKGASWKDKFRFVKGFCEQYASELDTILEHSKNPKRDFPDDWAQREAVTHILNRIKEIADEETGTEIERIDRQLNFMLDGMTKMGDKVVQLENTLRDIKHAIGTAIK